MRRVLKLAMTLIAIAAINVTVLNAQTRNQVRKMEYNSSYNYEVATIAVGVDGTKLIEVWGYGKKAEDATRNAKMNAVACAIFKGFPAAGGGKAAKTPPICSNSNAADEHYDYFEKFFEPGGQYLLYVNMSSDVAPKRIKMDKHYKCGIAVSIAFDELRKELEKQGIARALDAGF